MAHRDDENWDLPILLVPDGSHIAEESKEEDYKSAEERFLEKRNVAREIEESSQRQFIEKLTETELAKAFYSLGAGENAKLQFQAVKGVESQLDRLESLLSILDADDAPLNSKNLITEDAFGLNKKKERLLATEDKLAKKSGVKKPNKVASKQLKKAPSKPGKRTSARRSGK